MTSFFIPGSRQTQYIIGISKDTYDIWPHLGPRILDQGALEAWFVAPCYREPDMARPLQTSPGAWFLAPCYRVLDLDRAPGTGILDPRTWGPGRLYQAVLGASRLGPGKTGSLDPGAWVHASLGPGSLEA